MKLASSWSFRVRLSVVSVVLGQFHCRERLRVSIRAHVIASKVRYVQDVNNTAAINI